MPQKSSKNSSVVWKATIASVKVIEQGLAWHIGNGTRVRLGRDLWVGCSGRYALSGDLIAFFNNRGLLCLNYIVDPVNSSIWKQQWRSGNALQLEARWMGEWENYILDLQNSNVRIQDKPDELRWVHSQPGALHSKSGI